MEALLKRWWVSDQYSQGDIAFWLQEVGRASQRPFTFLGPNASRTGFYQ